MAEGFSGREISHEHRAGQNRRQQEEKDSVIPDFGTLHHLTADNRRPSETDPMNDSFGNLSNIENENQDLDHDEAGKLFNIVVIQPEDPAPKGEEQSQPEEDIVSPGDLRESSGPITSQLTQNPGLLKTKSATGNRVKFSEQVKDEVQNTAPAFAEDSNLKDSLMTGDVSLSHHSRAHRRGLYLIEEYFMLAIGSSFRKSLTDYPANAVIKYSLNGTYNHPGRR